MTTMPQDLRSFIIGSTAVTAQISTRCHYNHIPMNSAKPYVWFRVTEDNEPLCMDGTGGMHQSLVDLECSGLTEESVQAVADAVKDRLHGYKGTLGSISAKGVFVAGKDDDYIPFTNQSDDGIRVIAFSVNLWYST